MNYLVTGGAGFIGSHLVDKLLEQQVKVLVIDKLTYASFQWQPTSNNPNFKFIKVDISKREEVFDRLKEIQDFLGDKFSIFNLAAESHVDRSINSADEFILTNVLGTQVMLDFARKTQALRFLHVSTDEVYGSLHSGEATEDFPLNPSSAYSASKASSDLIVLAHQKTFGTNAIITRCVNNFGPRQSLEKFIPRTISRVLSGQKVVVYGNGANVREWIYVEDHCKSLISVMNRGQSGQVINIGSGERFSNVEIVQMITEIMKNETAISFVKDRPGHDHRYALDSSKFRNLVDNHNTITIRQGLRHTLNYYEDYSKTKMFQEEFGLMENSYGS